MEALSWGMPRRKWVKTHPIRHLRVAYDCVQLHGGYGYMEEYPICRWYRDIRASSIYAGTTEIMKTIIAKDLGL